MKIDNVIEKSDGDYSRPKIRLHNFHIDSTRSNKTKFFRRDPIIITNTLTKQWTIAFCLGSGGTKGLMKNTAAIEYDTADILGIKIGNPCNLKIKKANYFELLRWNWKHPDQPTRMAMQHSIIGTALAIVGVYSLF